VLRAQFGEVVVWHKVSLDPHDSSVVRFAPAEFQQLHVGQARLWWPAGMGGQPLYDLNLSFTVGDVVSDKALVRFGMREITSEFTPLGARLFRVNGRRVLIRGGGWAPDMMMRANPERQDAELRYALDLHL